MTCLRLGISRHIGVALVSNPSAASDPASADCGSGGFKFRHSRDRSRLPVYLRARARPGQAVRFAPCSAGRYRSHGCPGISGLSRIWPRAVQTGEIVTIGLCAASPRRIALKSFFRPESMDAESIDREKNPGIATVCTSGDYRSRRQLVKAAVFSPMSASRLVRQLAKEGFLEESRRALRVVRAQQLKSPCERLVIETRRS
jgi:hypothetical protein